MTLPNFFCDHRCWRCSLSATCPVPALATDAWTTPSDRVAAVIRASLIVTMEAAMKFAESSGDQVDEPLSVDVATGRSPYDFATDALVMDAAEYAKRTVLVARRWAATAAAVSIEEMCLSIASKIYRAVSGEYETSDVQSDANGSAKVALMLIDESLNAWRQMETDWPAAERTPGNVVMPLAFLHSSMEHLRRLREALVLRFPDAPEFVRPGFDDAESGGEDGQ